MKKQDSSRDADLTELSALFFSISETRHACKLWPKTQLENGRPVLKNGVSRLYPQEITYSWYYGKPLNLVSVYFTCNNPRCVNPQHIVSEYVSQPSPYDPSPLVSSAPAEDTLELLSRHRPYVIEPLSARSQLDEARRLKVFALDKQECVYCGLGFNLVVDHVVPVAQGGSDDPGNLVTACNWCNATKSDRTPSQANLVLSYGRFRLELNAA
jgi:hypothetical protein